jgi:hypothetical protein
MNEQPSPIDSRIRAQLARRAAGRMPEDLERRVYEALDGAGAGVAGRGAEAAGRGAGRGIRLGWPGVTWTGPRLAGSAVAVAFVAIVAVALGLPALRSGPAGRYPGYPADRALTTVELAEVLAGPALPVNTALVASVTIARKMDVCPMNRYPTVGVIEGMGSQVCVMGADVSAYMKVDKESGVFAFRYLAPGVLGLLGQITAASDSRLAFGSAAEWPTGDTYPGKTFLVEGWLGSTPYPQSIGSVQIACDQPLYEAGDPLNPEGGDNLCSTSWLAEDPGTGATLAMGDGSWIASVPSGHPVTAGGARYYDSISTTPTRGVYVVRYETGPCPGASPASSVGCPGYRVLAKLADLSLPTSSITLPASPSLASPAISPEAPATPLESASPSITLPAPSASPSGAAPLGLAGEGGRPLTVDEFRHAWATDPAHLTGRIVIAKGPIPTGFECSSTAAPGASASPGACLVEAMEGQIAAEGYWAVKVYADGKLAIVGEVKTPNGSFIYKVSELRVIGPPASGDLVVMYGWLRQDGLAGSPTGTADGLVTVQPETWAFIAGPRASEPLEGFFLVQYGNPATVLAALAQLTEPQL